MAPLLRFTGSLFALSLPLGLATAQDAGSGEAARSQDSEQVPQPVPEREKAQKVAVRGFAIYELETSRRLFAACDLDGDDRIGFFEAGRTLFEAKDRAGFRNFDLDQDGSIEFDEFDGRFRRLTEAGQEFYLEPAALVRLARGIDTPRAAPTLLQQFFGSQDQNHDDQLSFDEWKVIATLLKPWTGLDAAASFRNFDQDASGQLTIDELRPLLPQLELVTNALRQSSAIEALRPLPAEFAAADRNADSLLDRSEFRYALQRIHPVLQRYADRILRRADQNRDEALDALELRQVLERERGEKGRGENERGSERDARERATRNGR